MQGKRPIVQSKVVFVSLLVQVVDMLNTIQEIITLSKGDQVASARAAIIACLCSLYDIIIRWLTVGQ